MNEQTRQKPDVLFRIDGVGLDLDPDSIEVEGMRPKQSSDQKKRWVSGAIANGAVLFTDRRPQIVSRVRAIGKLLHAANQEGADKAALETEIARNRADLAKCYQDTEVSLEVNAGHEDHQLHLLIDRPRYTGKIHRRVRLIQLGLNWPEEHGLGYMALTNDMAVEGRGFAHLVLSSDQAAVLSISDANNTVAINRVIAIDPPNDQAPQLYWVRGKAAEETSFLITPYAFPAEISVILEEADTAPVKVVELSVDRPATDKKARTGTNS